MVSLSHNLVTDSVLNKIAKNLKELRCLNIAHNQIVDIRRLVTSVKLCPKLKILATFGNPISMLAIYYTYITEQI
jgi:Leucine-rich repeat (LRR) protein